MYKNKIVTIIGMGLTGLSSINFFKYKKSSVINIIDNNTNPQYIDKCPKDINIYLGLNNNFLDVIKKTDLIVLSPSISKKINILKYAKYNNIPIYSDIDIFFNEFKTKYKKIIVVTGTNGKSTVVSIIYDILINNNLKVFLGGNIGNPLLNYIDDIYDYYIIELSSFQIFNSSFDIKSYISIILNINSDHMDKHKNFYEYICTKLRIFNNSLNCIFNLKDNNIIKFLYKNNSNKNYISIGNSNNSNYYINNINNIPFLFKKKERILNCNDIKLLGFDNYLNCLFAIAATDILNIDKNIQINSIINFKPLKHRLNIITKNKYILINDSKSTNEDSTIFALNSIINNFKYNKIHLILGGDIKKSKFTKLNDLINSIENIFIYCFGKDRNIIYKIINKKVYKFYNLEKIFIFLKSKIEINDLVLLSPACSSLDQYKNYKLRGNHFIYLTNKYLINYE